MARALRPARRRRGGPTKALCLRRPNAYTGQQGGQCLNCSLICFYRAKRRAQAFFLLDKQEADYSHHPSAGQTEKCSQIDTCMYVRACVFMCVRLEQCTHTNCTVCIKCEHVCIHMYKLIFYTRYCNRFVLYMQWVCFISIVPSALIWLH